MQPGLFGGGVLVVTGIRDLAPDDAAIVERALAARLAGGVAEVRVGGAVGVDTVAMEVVGAGGAALHVFAPDRLETLPLEARDVARRHATRVTELRRDPRRRESYLRRNDAMLRGADAVLAFIDDRTRGGTWYTLREGRRLGLDVEVVSVRRA